MTLVDYTVITIVGFSVLLSIFRGLTRELIAIAGWVAAFVVASVYSADLAPRLSDDIPGEPLRLLAAFLILFLAVLMASSLIAVTVSRLVKRAGLSVEDRLLGAVFGFARGLLVVVVLALLAGLTALPRQPVWTQAWVSPPLEWLALKLRTFLPHDWSQHIRYR